MGIYFQLKYYPRESINLLPGAAPWFNIKMIPIFISYILGCIAIGLAFILALWGVRPNSRYANFAASDYFWRFFIFCFIVNAIFLSFENIITSISPVFILALAIINPYIFSKIPLYYFKRILCYMYKSCSYILLIASFAFIGFLYKDFTFHQEVILNPFYRMPELYLKSQKFLFGYKYDGSTTSLINEFKLMGNHDKADINNIFNWKDNRACIQVEENSKQIYELTKEYSNILTFEMGDIIKGNAAHIIYPPILFYKENRLCVFEAEGLNIPLVNYVNRVLWKKLKDIGINRPKEFLLAKKMNEQIDTNKLIVEDYLKDMELNNYHQILARGVLKHQQHYYIPALEYGLGRPLNEISHQYGLGLTLILANLSKVLSSDGLSSYGVFLSTMPWLWYISVIIFVAAMFGIFHKPNIVIIPTLILVLNRLYMGGEGILVSGGIGVYRTLFFPILLYFIYRYYLELTIQKFFLCCVTSLVCLFINFEFGAALSFLGVEIIYFVIHKKFSYFCRIFFIILCIVIGKTLFDVGTNPISSVFLQGYLSVPLHLKDLLSHFIIFIMCCFAFIYMYKRQSKYTFVFIFLVFLRYLILIYYIWSGMKNHYTVYYTDMMMPFVVFFVFILYEINKNNIIHLVLTYAIVALLVINIVNRVPGTFYTINSYNNAVESCNIYEWESAGTQFKSTLNPEFFSDTEALIQKYTPEDTPYIYILSQYDSFLTFISRKYSAMPHFDLTAFLITQEMKQSVIDCIKINKPYYLFVDNDIELPYEFDLIPKATFNSIALHAESRSKVLTLNQMREIYKEVISDYTPIERSRLITVYQYNPQK